MTPRCVLQHLQTPAWDWAPAAHSSYQLNYKPWTSLPAWSHIPTPPSKLLAPDSALSSASGASNSGSPFLRVLPWPPSSPQPLSIFFPFANTHFLKLSCLVICLLCMAPCHPHISPSGNKSSGKGGTATCLPQSPQHLETTVICRMFNNKYGKGETNQNTVWSKYWPR